jgi:hypothetical protein
VIGRALKLMAHDLADQAAKSLEEAAREACFPDELIDPSVCPSGAFVGYAFNGHRLRNKEAALYHLLYENRGRIVTRDMIAERLWGSNFVGESNSIEVHICNLRKKIAGFEKIRTVKNGGYVLEAK